MCGIFGYLDHQSDKSPDERKLQQTARLLAHRGPDGQTTFSGPSAGLVHTRLSLVDLNARSDQPFWDKTGRYALVYNGEIYNYRELREDLQRKGVTFKTTGDTEVLLECLLRGELTETLLKLEGMFAFELYDKLEKSLLVVRDRIGIKPLYVYDDGTRFIFSSEIGAMRPWIAWKENPGKIVPYLFGLHGVTDGHGLYEGVQSVVPGSVIRVKAGSQPQFDRFFELSDFWDEEQRRKFDELSPVQAVDLIEKKLLASVRLQLRADAPLGVFCSGGVDSSLIAAMAARLGRNLTVFHSNIVGKQSEYAAARALAAHLKLDFVAKDVTDENYLERIPDMMERAEYPYRHLPTSVPFMMLSERASSMGVKGLLTGEASDECFLGYAEYAHNVLLWTRQAPKKLYLMLKRKMKRLPMPRHASNDIVRSFHDRFRNDLEKLDIYREIQRKSTGTVRSFHMHSYYDFCENIRALTHRNDSMGMAAGIEGRFPFLDSDLIRSAFNMPYRYKLRFSLNAWDPKHLFIRDKWVIRKVADRYLPRHLSRRPKLPWPTTFLERMQVGRSFFAGGSLREWLQFSEREMQYLLEHVPTLVLRNLMYLEIWAHVCFYRLPKEAIWKKMKDHIRIRPEKAPAGKRSIPQNAAAPPSAPAMQATLTRPASDPIFPPRVDSPIENQGPALSKIRV